MSTLIGIRIGVHLQLCITKSPDPPSMDLNLSYDRSGFLEGFYQDLGCRDKELRFLYH